VTLIVELVTRRALLIVDLGNYYQIVSTGIVDAVVGVDLIVTTVVVDGERRHYC
jgi:hypothetical protein